jgi:para-nitrobenzyl esterase
VTLWGESAGAYSVCAHLAAPVSRRLFDRAIVQCGPCGDDLLSRVEADQRGELAATDLGCGDAADVAECLRQVPVEAIAGYLTGEIGFRRTSAELLWWPVAGTVLLPKQPLHAMRAGLANPVPVLLGGTRDEMRSYVIEHHDGIGEPLSPEAFPDVVAGLYGDEAPAVLDEYRLDQFESPGIALATILTDEGRFQGACQRLPYLDAASLRSPTSSPS